MFIPVVDGSPRWLTTSPLLFTFSPPPRCPPFWFDLSRRASRLSTSTVMFGPALGITSASVSTGIGGGAAAAGGGGATLAVVAVLLLLGFGTGGGWYYGVFHVGCPCWWHGLLGVYNGIRCLSTRTRHIGITLTDGIRQIARLCSRPLSFAEETQGWRFQRLAFRTSFPPHNY